LEPQDWQIDLGNFCNSACIFCAPTSSSKMATEFKKLGLINDMPKKNWADNPVLLENFIKVLTQSKKISYLHFLGGETLITPAFETMLTALIDAGMHKNVSIGLTTNLTVWPQKVIDLLVQYKEVNLGMSIECLHQANDYLRWPSKIDQVKIILEKWVDLAKKHNWLIQIRSTPNILSILHLKELYEYAFEKNIGIESCNFLYNPKFMKISLLPNDFRNHAETFTNENLSWFFDEVLGSTKKMDYKIVRVKNNQIKVKDGLALFHKEKLGLLNKISYNLRQDLLVFIETFVDNEGIKESIVLIEEC
jgi:sulfatase maturation enzyme AslB (radical SAM superfamily)